VTQQLLDCAINREYATYMQKDTKQKGWSSAVSHKPHNAPLCSEIFLYIKPTKSQPVIMLKKVLRM